MKFHYIYIHASPEGIPFYVGKGSGRRAHNMTDRNSSHQSQIDNFGKKCVLVYIHYCNSSEHAYDCERWMIEYGRNHRWPLTNKNSGGYGGTGTSEQIRRGRLITNRNKLFAVDADRIESWQNKISNWKEPVPLADQLKSYNKR